MTALPNRVKCKRCKREKVTDDLASIKMLAKDFPQITKFAGLTFIFEFCECCRTPADGRAFPQVALTQEQEHPVC